MTAIHTLHILNKSPEHPRASRCLATVSPEDALLLTGNGVLLLSTQKKPVTHKVFVLSPDVDARGLGGMTGNAEAVGFAEMVSLSLQAQRVISW
ncbi:sulfurtransferase complex subunit TusB [Marinobacter sp.]|uniref:sulfurtransferase complex subunit TusB n=1 Tax=Marinobacter sp. TaxID=50741 RepID=UPI003565B36E